jgi:hypothetical protein
MTIEAHRPRLPTYRLCAQTILAVHRVDYRLDVDGRPYMRAIFAFARDGAPQSSSGEKASIAPYRHMREWAKSQRATRAGLFRRAIRHWAGSASDALERRQGNGHLLSDRIAAALIVEPRVEKELSNARWFI